MTISFSFEPWDDTKDRLFYRSGSPLGFTAIQSGLEVGEAESIRKRRKDALIWNTEQGVIGLVAGGLEWLRKRGYSAETVQSRVKVYKEANRDPEREILLRTKVVLDAVEQISNSKSRKLESTVVLP